MLSLSDISNSLAIRGLPQADVFAEIGNSMVDCTNDNRGRRVPD